jgi:hypothetical protein
MWAPTYVAGAHDGSAEVNALYRDACHTAFLDFAQGEAFPGARQIEETRAGCLEGRIGVLQLRNGRPDPDPLSRLEAVKRCVEVFLSPEEERLMTPATMLTS